MLITINLIIMVLSLGWLTHAIIQYILTIPERAKVRHAEDALKIQQENIALDKRHQRYLAKQKKNGCNQ